MRETLSLIGFFFFLFVVLPNLHSPEKLGEWVAAFIKPIALAIGL